MDRFCLATPEPDTGGGITAADACLHDSRVPTAAVGEPGAAWLGLTTGDLVGGS